MLKKDSDPAIALQAAFIRLSEISERLKAVQAKRNGSITLDLVKCGKDCDYCPHYRWKKWVGKQKYSDKTWWRGYPTKTPLRSHYRKDYPQEAVDLIKEAKVIIEVRARLIQKITVLKIFPPHVFSVLPQSAIDAAIAGVDNPPTARFLAKKTAEFQENQQRNT